MANLTHQLCDLGGVIYLLSGPHFPPETRARGKDFSCLLCVAYSEKWCQWTGVGNWGERNRRKSQLWLSWLMLWWPGLDPAGVLLRRMLLRIACLGPGRGGVCLMASVPSKIFPRLLALLVLSKSQNVWVGLHRPLLRTGDPWNS